MMVHLSGLTSAWLINQLLLIIMMNFVVPIFTTSRYLTSIFLLGCLQNWRHWNSSTGPCWVRSELSSPAWSSLSPPTSCAQRSKSMEMHHKSLPEVTPRNNGGFNIKNVSVGYQRGYVASDYKKACHRSPGLHRSGHCLKPSWTGVQRIVSSLHTLSPEVCIC